MRSRPSDGDAEMKSKPMQEESGPHCVDPDEPEQEEPEFSNLAPDELEQEEPGFWSLDPDEPEQEKPVTSGLDLDEPEDDGGQSLDDVGTSQTFMLRLSPRDAVSIGWRSICQVAGIGLAEAVTIVALPLLLRSTINSLQVDGLVTGKFALLVAGMIAVSVFGSWARGIEFSVSESIGYRFVNRLRMVMYAHLQRISGRQLLNITRGAILLRFTGDLTAIRTWVSRGIATGVIASIVIIAGIVILAVLDRPTVVVVMGILVAGAVMSLVVGAMVQKSARAVRHQRANLTTNLTDQIHGMATVQALGRSSGEYHRVERQSARLTEKLIRYARLRGWLRMISNLSASLAVIAVVVVGAFSFDAGHMTIGTLVAAMIVAQQIWRPIRLLGLSQDYWQSARVSREKISGFLRHPYREVDSFNSARLHVRRGRIKFRNVILAGSLNGVTAEVEPGQIVAIMGPNGAGKTSLLSVTARIADPDAGEVLVDDQILANCSLRSCATQISLMSRDLPLMRGSLRRNLLYRWREAPESELNRVIELCGIREVIAQFPEGLAAHISENGANLSAGHVARVSLARSLMGNPKILLLDEPTLNLDDATKRILREIVLHYGGTVLLVTHDPEDAALADTVWQMEAGRIVSIVSGETFRESIAKSALLPIWARAGDRR